MISLVADTATAEAAIVEQGLGARVSIAAINGPRSVVIGGEDADLAAVLEALPDGTKSTRVRATHPDHTALMEPVAVAVGKRCEELLSRSPPSTASCFWATSVADWPMGDMTSIGRPEYWRQGIVGNVDYPRALAAVVQAYAEAGVSGKGPRQIEGAPRCRTLRFVELGEGMLVRFSQGLRCISDTEAELGHEVDFGVAFSHLLPRKASKDLAADAHEVAKAIEEIKVAARALTA